jgi:hypothetical protein
MVLQKNEVGRLQAIKHPRKSLGTFLKCREPSSFLHLNKNCNRGLVNYKRASAVELVPCIYFLKKRVLFFSQGKPTRV